MERTFGSVATGTPCCHGAGKPPGANRHRNLATARLSASGRIRSVVAADGRAGVLQDGRVGAGTNRRKPQVWSGPILAEGAGCHLSDQVLRYRGARRSRRRRRGVDSGSFQTTIPHLRFLSFAGNTCLGFKLGDAALDEAVNLAHHLAPGRAACGLETGMDACGQIEAEPLGRLGGLAHQRRSQQQARPCRSCPAPFLS